MCRWHTAGSHERAHCRPRTRRRSSPHSRFGMSLPRTHASPRDNCPRTCLARRRDPPRTPFRNARNAPDRSPFASRSRPRGRRCNRPTPDCSSRRHMPLRPYTPPSRGTEHTHRTRRLHSRPAAPDARRTGLRRAYATGRTTRHRSGARAREHRSRCSPPTEARRPYAKGAWKNPPRRGRRTR
jgi:hypothetical protein